ncbi:MAG: ferrous iron transporter B [Bacillota bacterium]|nr:ferrous iron transporter B [Bacillota bacterium]
MDALNHKKVLLLGFPNVGKSLLFHHLTGAYVIVSNYPGTTVEVTRGKGKIGYRDVEIIDTPGIYSLQGRSQDEKVTMKVLSEEKPHLILFVAETAALPRTFDLLRQLKDYRTPSILVLNMIDEAERRGISINEKVLEKELQIPVVPTISTQKVGIRELKKKMETLLFPSFSLDALHDTSRKKEKPLLQRQPANCSEKGFHSSFEVTDPFSIKNSGYRLHHLLINPWIGYPLVFLLLFFCFYLFLGVLGAGTIVSFLEKRVFTEIVIPYCRIFVEKYLGSLYLREYLFGDYGLITMGLRYSLAIVLPIVGIFFLFFALLEDCGYLPRLSYLLHRPLRYLGLDGRGAVPLVMGFGCGTMAVLVTRLLETRRERFLATFLLSLGIPCSAQLGLLVAILAPYPRLLLIWGFTWGILFITSGLLLNRLYPGEKGYSCIEFPPLRVPRFSAVLQKTGARILWYLREVVPFFLLISVALQALVIKGYWGSIENFFSPLFLSMGLPRETVSVFLVGFLRRDYAAAGLYDLMQQGILAPASALIGATVLSLFFPCIAQLIIIFKERGTAESLFILLLIAIITYGIGTIMHTILFL